MTRVACLSGLTREGAWVSNHVTARWTLPPGRDARVWRTASANAGSSTVRVALE